MEAVEINSNETMNLINLQEYKEYLSYLKSLQNDILSGKDDAENRETTSRNSNSRGKTLEFRKPGAPKYYEEEETNQKTGYTSPLMLSLLTFLFEVLFLILSFHIFQ